jgi:hypothetical protein
MPLRKRQERCNVTSRDCITSFRSIDISIRVTPLYYIISPFVWRCSNLSHLDFSTYKLFYCIQNIAGDVIDLRRILTPEWTGFCYSCMASHSVESLFALSSHARCFKCSTHVSVGCRELCCVCEARMCVRRSVFLVPLVLLRNRLNFDRNLSRY